MSYQALYRKYRPSTLKDVIGQDVVIKILKNAIKNDKIGHAYLFSGPRGIGKTSIAKLLAKTVNCLNVDSDGCACEKCENCLSINNDFSPDIIEIDAASNNGVDEIREIKNKINLVPNQLKYKVYIIDEVHMLSIGAFNALLKTLEEPPEHIIFILATTDPQKVPATIISRCQCFEFHRISTKNIVERLKFICECEKIEVDSDVLEKIAELSDGGLRDSVGMLDKLNAYSNSTITMEDFEKVNGIVSISDKINFLKLVEDKNVIEIIKFIDYIYDNGKDLIIFVQDLLQICKDKCINYYVDNDNSFNIEFLLSFSKLLNDLSISIKNTSNVKTILEINLLSFMNKIDDFKEKNEQKSPKIVENSEKNSSNIKKIEENSQKNDEKFTNSVDNEIDFKKYNKQVINNCFARANKLNKQLFEEKWKSLEDYALDSKFGAAASFLTDGVVRAVGDGEVIISFKFESMVNRGFNLLEIVQKLFEKVYNNKYDIAFLTEDEWNYEKNEFINNKNNGISYTFIPIDNKFVEKVENTDNNSITSQAIELFGNDVISVD